MVVPKKTTRILIADALPIVMIGVRTILEQEKDFCIVGETSDGLDAMDLVEQLQPDVMIVDATMPGLNGIEVTRQVSKRYPEMRILILSMYENEAQAIEALKNGASGYLLKNEADLMLTQAIRTVLSGHRHLSPLLLERAIDIFVQEHTSTRGHDYYSMTPREHQVLQLAAEGYSNATIATKLSISIRTAETHRCRMMYKLGIRNQTDIVRYALKLGILPMEPEQ